MLLAQLRGTNLSAAATTKFVNTVLAGSDENPRHNSYEEEKLEMQYIEQGRPDQLRACWSSARKNQVGTVSKDRLRSAKYLGVINVALSARAAIRGGISSELAFSLSDLYVQMIDELTLQDMDKMEPIVRNIQSSFAQLTAQRRVPIAEDSAVHPLVTRAKAHVYTHLQSRITVNDLAEELHTHPSYLNRIFKQSQGLSLHDFIIREKIYLVQSLLLYTQNSYVAIAMHTGFSSQSHLGDVFKRETGMTMKQFRESHR